jgi:hypothetical protein
LFVAHPLQGWKYDKIYTFAAYALLPFWEICLFITMLLEIYPVAGVPSGAKVLGGWKPSNKQYEVGILLPSSEVEFELLGLTMDCF